MHKPFRIFISMPSVGRGKKIMISLMTYKLCYCTVERCTVFNYPHHEGAYSICSALHEENSMAFPTSRIWNVIFTIRCVIGCPCSRQKRPVQTIEELRPLGLNKIAGAWCLNQGLPIGTTINPIPDWWHSYTNYSKKENRFRMDLVHGA